MVPAHDDFAVARGAMYMLAPGDSEYCLPELPVAETLQSGLLTYFGSRTRAEAVGLRPCTSCRPGPPSAPRGQLSGPGPASSADAVLFPGFRAERIRTRETEIHTVVGGQGPPVLLLHGYPETHACWHRIAPALAERFTVVCPDLRGYGDSGRPASDADHRAYSKRTMAEDQREIMARLGFERFAVVGHDRGGRVAYRLALDHPDRVTHLAVLDIVPTLETWARLDRQAGLETYHWYFLAQPPDLPERLIGADPDYFLRWTLESWAGRGHAFDPRALAEYRRAFRDPQVIHATWRTIAPAPRSTSRTTRPPGGAAGSRAPCSPSGRRASEARDAWDSLGIWRAWAEDVGGRSIPGGHFLSRGVPGRRPGRPPALPGPLVLVLPLFHTPGRAVSQGARRRTPQ